MERLDDAAIAAGLRDLAWARQGDTLVKTVILSGFDVAMAFVNSVAAEAVRCDHHPDIDIRYNRVILTLSTHDAGGVTQLDLDLAAVVDRLVP